MPYKDKEKRRQRDRERRELKRLMAGESTVLVEQKKKEMADATRARRSEASKAPRVKRPRPPRSRNPQKQAELRRLALGKRRCGEEGCTTILSSYNTESYCAIHAPAYNTRLSDFL